MFIAVRPSFMAVRISLRARLIVGCNELEEFVGYAWVACSVASHGNNQSFIEFCCHASFHEAPVCCEDGLGFVYCICFFYQAEVLFLGILFFCVGLAGEEVEFVVFV